MPNRARTWDARGGADAERVGQRRPRAAEAFARPGSRRGPGSPPRRWHLALRCFPCRTQRMQKNQELRSVPPHPEALRAELAEALSLEGRGGRGGGHPRASRLAPLAPQHEGGEKPARSTKRHSRGESRSTQFNHLGSTGQPWAEPWHPFRSACRAGNGAEWIAGSSPAMTTERAMPGAGAIALGTGRSRTVAGVRDSRH